MLEGLRLPSNNNTVGYFLGVTGFIQEGIAKFLEDVLLVEPGGRLGRHAVRDRHALLDDGLVGIEGVALPFAGVVLGPLVITSAERS